MSKNYKDLVQTICHLAELENVNVTISKSHEGALVTGACALLGGLIGGGKGSAVGGVLGSLAAWGMCSGSFHSLKDAIMKDLSEDQRKQLVQHICQAINCMDIDKIIKLLLENKSVQQAALSAASNFVSSKLQGATVNK